MPQSENQPSQQHQTSLDSTLGTIVAEIGRGGQGYVASTDKGKALKVVSLNNDEGSLNTNAVKELVLNIALKHAANEHHELKKPLIIMDQWNITDGPVTDEDKGRNLVFSMPLHHLSKLETFDLDETDQKQSKDSYVSSLHRLLPAYQSLHDMGFYPGDINLFADQTNQQILLADYDQFSIYANSEVEQYVNEAYAEMKEGFKARGIADDALPKREEIIAPRERSSYIHNNINYADRHYSAQVGELLSMVDVSMDTNLAHQFYEIQAKNLPFPAQIDQILSLISPAFDDGKTTHQASSVEESQLAGILQGQDINSSGVAKASDNKKQPPNATPSVQTEQSRGKGSVPRNT